METYQKALFGGGVDRIKIARVVEIGLLRMIILHENTMKLYKIELKEKKQYINI